MLLLTFISSFYQSLRMGGGGVVGRHYSRYLSTLPLEKGLPDHKMGLISETLVGYQVHGHLWERGNEQSCVILLLYSY